MRGRVVWRLPGGGGGLPYGSEFAEEVEEFFGGDVVAVGWVSRERASVYGERRVGWWGGVEEC